MLVHSRQSRFKDWWSISAKCDLCGVEEHDTILTAFGAGCDSDRGVHHLPIQGEISRSPNLGDHSRQCVSYFAAGKGN